MNVCFNGEFFPAGQALLAVQNRGFKWGDGLFETMKVCDGKLLLAPLHFERLFSSLRLLGIRVQDAFTPAVLTANILSLCGHNACLQNARVRLAVFRSESGFADYTIEAMLLENKVNQWQQQGLSLTLFPFARKSMDAYANIKSANFLPYVLAANYAVEQQADDALVLNTDAFLCDSSRANLFIVQGKAVYTPALHQGCVNGVMRRVVIETVKRLGYRLHQGEIEESQLLAADEVFLTNAIQVIRWVATYKDREYRCEQSRKVFDAVLATIFSHTC